MEGGEVENGGDWDRRDGERLGVVLGDGGRLSEGGKCFCVVGEGIE